jgi:hypothetical protein
MRWLHSVNEPANAATFFDEHGFVGFHDALAADELEEVRNAADQASYADDRLTILQDAIFEIPVLEKFARHASLAKNAAFLLRAPVELHNSRLNTKPLDAG